MVFDNCQIDVFFHMRSHYNRLRNVQSVVDCSAPKGLRRLNQSNTSLQNAGMAPFCNNTSGIKSHNCKYTNCASAISPASKRCSSRAKSLPPRPGTRRHPDDMPLTRDMCSRSSRNSSRQTQEITKNSPMWNGRTNQTPRYRSKNKPQHHNPNISEVYYASANCGCEKLQSFHSRSDQDFRSKTDEPKLTPVNQEPVSSSEYGEPKESPKYNTPTGTPTYKPAHVSPRDHEYLQFLLKITEDIIQNDLYTNKEMKKVFVNHFEANKERLDTDRMILQIHQLMQELNIPLSDDLGEDSTPSWSEIETALKELGIDETKSKADDGTIKLADSKYKSCPGRQEKCICFDLRNLDQSLTVKRRIPDEEVENTNYDDYSTKNKFQTSLDRLTEHTEPISSQATFKASTITSSSTFGNVDVLPGFEGLDIPRTPKNSTFEKPNRSQCPEKSAKKVNCRSTRFRKKSKRRKRRRKSRRTRIKRPKSIRKASTCSKCIENVCQASIVAQSRGTDPYSEELLVERLPAEDRQKPLIITLPDSSGKQTSCNTLALKPSKNDYMLIKGPIYLLKTFLDENPNLVMRIEIPAVSTTTFNSKLENGDSSDPYKNDINHSENQDSSVKETPIPYISTKDTENKNTEVKDMEGVSTSEKYKEIRNILMQMTSTLSSESLSTGSESKDLTLRGAKIGSAVSTQTDETYASKFGMVSTTHLQNLCDELPCSNPCPYSQFCSSSTACVNENEDNLLLTNDYDLTPQRDNMDVGVIHMNQLIGEDYDVPSILQDFLMTREMQTEDLHVEPTIVAFARMQKDELPDKKQVKGALPSSSSSNEEMSSILNALGVNPGKSMNPNESLSSKQNVGGKSGIHFDKKRFGETDTDTTKSVTLRESLLTSYPTTSSAPVEKPNEATDELAQEFQMKLMFPFLQSPKLPIETPKADSDEAIAHTRRVSIMRTPIIQVPSEKMPDEVDDSRKIGESIMKAVDVFKERQATKDTHLAKALQDIEINREYRKVDKTFEDSRKPQGRPSLKSAIAKLPDQDTSSIDMAFAMDSPESSYLELPIKMSTQKQGLPSTVPVQEGIDEIFELKASSSQMNRIRFVTDKLDSLRSADNADDYEISATLDELILLKKREQETEEDIEIKDEDTSEQQSDTSVGKKYFRCCNFRKKKATFQKQNIQEPSQRDSFSEKQYRSKSEAFEMALIALGQASAITQDVEMAQRSREKNGDLMEVSSAQSIVLALGGTKLPPLKFGETSEKSAGGVNIDFDKISTMALHSTEDEKSARFKF